MEDERKERPRERELQASEFKLLSHTTPQIRPVQVHVYVMKMKILLLLVIVYFIVITIAL